MDCGVAPLHPLIAEKQLILQKRFCNSAFTKLLLHQKQVLGVEVRDRISNSAKTGVIATGMPRGENAMGETDDTSNTKSPVELEHMKADLGEISSKKAFAVFSF